ncbi:MAG: hypothetical protein H6550_08690 [Chitinophagales bacterium]|nr:hypothetical protein [Chitinophagales bacterium]
MYRILVFFMVSMLSCAHSIAQDKYIHTINTLDSLFLKGEYKAIISFCDESKYELNSDCRYNLIGAYYFSGDSAGAWRLLNNEITRITSNSSSAYSLDVLFDKDYSSYKKFLLTSTAKKYIMGLVDSIYMLEPVTEKESGKELLHLVIEDQWVRKMSSLYDHFQPDRKYLLPPSIDSMDAIKAQKDHCTKVFDFYQKQNKLFSETEVGTIYYLQLLLFFHEWDMTRREFYHKLLKEGVTSGAFKIEAQMNFEMSTQFIEMGALEFSKHRDEIQEEYRKKYSKPEYRYHIF